MPIINPTALQDDVARQKNAYPKNYILDQKQQLFLQEVIQGLQQKQKTLPCKYFYDEKGSALFEEICQLDEYYITRTELKLLDQIKHELAHKIGQDALIIEPGAGAGLKIQTLLGALKNPHSYVPMDISKDFLFYSASIIQHKFPQIEVLPIQVDFTQPINWLDQKIQPNRVVFFPGSTLGNFEPSLAIQFLNNMRQLVGTKGAIILGIDQLKSEQTLLQAYDDKQGVTARFNKNLLSRINKELYANFKLSQFKHQARFNKQLSRIEMHLVSQKNQQVSIDGQHFNFAKHESIHTENSHKYSDKMLHTIASKAQLKIVQTWQDPQNLIKIYYLQPTE
ncbi:MAG: L-histidine N(alpha)-methyltransferase [Enterobacterales bacterium]|nr:L-histidine N(alpha)-methyltransferase [Enterobacterales bacterium]